MDIISQIGGKLFCFSKYYLSIIIYISFLTNISFSQTNKVSILKVNGEHTLSVNDRPFCINGLNWDYFPIGTNYFYVLWNQPDEIIKAALDDEMSLWKNMGINSIRIYSGIPSKWITYIYEKYGIYTLLNHSFGRYGLTIDGAWNPNTDYSNPKVKNQLINEITLLAKEYKNTPGLLMYLLGNENNYGLFWDGAETENIPVADRNSTKRATAMYQLFNAGALAIKSIDPDHPIALCNGDLHFIDIIAKECKDVDVFASNMYRGASFGEAFVKVKKELGKPLLFTEFGADAYNVKTNEEDQKGQAIYLLENWKEIYNNTSGKGEGNCIGGYTFQCSDGWWKLGQTSGLEIHDIEPSWSNDAYPHDFISGENNMNEEWFGICAKGKANAQGLYKLYPRTAYYILQEAHQLNPYKETVASILTHFSSINIASAELKARGDKAILFAEQSGKISLSRFSSEFTTYNTGGHFITTPKKAKAGSNVYPNQQGFDHTQSFYIGVEAQPISKMSAHVEFNILGNVAQNPIDQIFYENRGRPFEVVNNGIKTTIYDNNRIQLYRASYKWEHSRFFLNGFYRTGHYHWGYEGDFFGLYPEANYGPNIDIYNGNAPFGFELTGKKSFRGIKLAFGPQLWWGANPALLLKYSKEIKKIKLSAVFHEDIQQLGNTESSFAIPQPKTRRLGFHVSKNYNKLNIDLGGLWAGQPLNGRSFQLSRMNNGSTTIYEDKIKSIDNFGGKLKLTYHGKLLKWYAQSAIHGLVANGGTDLTQTFTGWKLKDCGSGNQYNFLSGVHYRIRNLELSPNFLWQKPIEGPIPGNAAAPGRPRNILSDPFVVRSNREQLAGEILFTYDPTPGTWMYEWDNDKNEDAEFALSAGFVYRHLPTTMDAAIGLFGDGRTTFAFPGAPPAHDLWELNARIVSKTNKSLGMIANFYFGDAQANGNDSRLIRRFGTDIKTIYKHLKFHTFFKVNDWGPYDYHRDFNLTFPLQSMIDLSISPSKPDWLILPSSRLGIMCTYRTLDKYSPRYAPTYIIDAAGNSVPNPNAIGYKDGNEWEIRTYIHINFIK